MAQINKSQNSFLWYLNNIHETSETAKLACNVVNRRKPYSAKGYKSLLLENKINKAPKGKI